MSKRTVFWYPLVQIVHRQKLFMTSFYKFMLVCDGGGGTHAAVDILHSSIASPLSSSQSPCVPSSSPICFPMVTFALIKKCAPKGDASRSVESTYVTAAHVGN